jgi:uncharacterized membrane protein
MDEETNPSEENAEIAENEVQKRAVVGPFFMTLIVLAVVGALAYMPTYFDQAFFEDPENAENNGWLYALAQKSEGWWVDNAGDYHPLILHTPIGIVFLALAMEVLGWLSFGKYKPRTTLALFLAFFGGALACVSGMFMLKSGGGYGADTSVAFDVEQWKKGWANDMFKHMWMGISFVAVVGLAFLSKIWARPGAGRGPIYAILLFGTAAVMGYGSHFGGLKTHKTDPVLNTLVGLELVEPETEKKDEKDDDDGTPTVPAASKEPKDRLAFRDVVYQIMDSKCLVCHMDDKPNKRKVKGGLEMNTFENLLNGGDSQDGDEYRTLVPGDAKASYMIEVMNLPMDDDMHMPPSKKTQMDEGEIEVLTWWVNALPKGATELEDKTLAELGAPAEIIEFAAKVVTPEEKAAAEAAKAEAAKKAEEAKQAKREALQNALDSLKQQDAFKTSLGYVSQDSSDLDFTSVSLGPNLNDEILAKLAPVSEALVSLDVSRSSVTEAALAAELPKMKSLRRLNLSQTEVGDGLLDVIAQLEGLEYLNVYGTKVTDAGIIKLKTLTGLKQLFGWQSQVTEVGAKALKKELPGLYVNLGGFELK